VEAPGCQRRKDAVLELNHGGKGTISKTSSKSWWEVRTVEERQTEQNERDQGPPLRFTSGVLHDENSVLLQKPYIGAGRNLDGRHRPHESRKDEQKPKGNNHKKHQAPHRPRIKLGRPQLAELISKRRRTFQKEKGGWRQ